MNLPTTRLVSTPAGARGAATLALALLVAAGIWFRFQFIAMHGGLDPSYLDWAMTNYFGGITAAYLNGADAIQTLRPFPTLAYPPGYPALIALFRSLGVPDLQQLRHVQAGLEAAVGVVAAYRVVRVAGAARPWALIGSTFYALYPPLAIGAGFILAEALSPSLLLLCVLGTVWVSRRPTTARLAVLGFGLGIVSLVRPDFALLGGPIALWLWIWGGVPVRLLTAGVLMGSFLLALLPWGIHNRVVHGAWVITSTGGSASLWEGLGEIDNPYGYVLSDEYTSNMLRDKGYTWHSVEADRYLRQDYLRAWREHPEFVLEVAAHRWQQILWTSEQFQTEAFRGLQDTLDRYGLLFCVLALALGFRRGGVWLAVFLPVSYALLSIGMVHYEPRYVRYVHLAYFFAALIVLARLTSFPGRARHVSPAVGVVALGLATAYAVQEIPLVQAQVRVARFTALVEGPGHRALVSVPPVPDTTWSLLPGARMLPEGSATQVVTPVTQYEYIATRPYDLSTADMVVVHYDLTLIGGGITVGMLDPDGAWMKTVNLLDTGRHQGSFVAEVEMGGQAVIVLAAANDTPQVTELTLHSIAVSVKAPVAPETK